MSLFIVKRLGIRSAKKEIEHPICLVCASPGVWEQPASSACGCRMRRMGRPLPHSPSWCAPGPGLGAGLLGEVTLKAVMEANQKRAIGYHT